jgi:quinol monooxygenase YgiN
MSADDLKALDHPISGVVVILLVDYLRQHQAWGWMRLIAGPSALREIAGLSFAKVMGSGQNGGFSLRPSPSHQGLICVFDQWQSAVDFLHGSHVKSMTERAREWWYGIFAVRSARGQWDKQVWEPSNDSMCLADSGAQAHPQMLGVLTRANIRPAKAMAFWRHAPAAQADLEHAQGCHIAVGLGEAPLVRQCTFSLWQDSASMTQYAQHSSHLQAIQAAYRHSFFSESLFVRMQLLNMQGVWKERYYSHGPSQLTEASHVG